MSKLKGNFIYSCVYQLLIILLPIITAPYVSRILGADLLGQYTYTYTIAYYFVMFVMMGISNYGNRCIAATENKKDRNKVFTEIYTFQLIWGGIISIIYILFIFIKNDNIDIYIYIIQFFYVISAVFDVSWYLFGREQFKLSVTRNIIIKILAVICIFTFVKNEEDIYIYTIIMSGFTLVGQVALWVMAIKEEKFRIVGLHEVKKHIKQILILFIPVLAVSIYAYMSKIILGNISSMEEVTYYDYAYKIISAPLGIITALGTVMLPRMSNLYANNKMKEANSLVNKSLRFVLLIALPMCVGLIIVSEKFCVLFYGRNFIKCGYIMSILALTIPFISLGNVIRTQFLIPLKRDKIFVNSVIAGAIINVIINYFLIPKFGAIGAAIATVITEIVVCIYQIYYVRDEIYIKDFLLSQKSVFISTAFMLGCTFIVNNLINESIIGVILIVFTGILSYGIITILVNSNIRNEIKKKVNIFQNK
ncbi:flippase [Clostridium sp. D53t1_180928_C8]|uniref:flippase n=1 Tax=Clostridium sp. D53t1_180928_C8 TaxID=2787101 RepID=UPI0018AC60CC|nr:flippase [Clostridium sp. D53t1_180928_C8]